MQKEKNENAVALGILSAKKRKKGREYFVAMAKKRWSKVKIKKEGGCKI